MIDCRQLYEHETPNHYKSIDVEKQQPFSDRTYTELKFKKR